MDRAQIIAEIKRCAEQNGGVPLGRLRFEAETGIAESVWIGRYWARWSDAIREAGHEPQALQQSLDDDFVLEELALFIKELGSFPTSPQLRMRRR